MFASFGKTGGACNEIGNDEFFDGNDQCVFEEQGEHVWLPEALGEACIGESNCAFTITEEGFEYNGVLYETGTGERGGEFTWDQLGAGTAEQKFKMLTLCEAPQ